MSLSSTEGVKITYLAASPDLVSAEYASECDRVTAQH